MRSRFSIAFFIRVLIVLGLHVCLLALLLHESKQEIVLEPEVIRLEVQMLTLPSPQISRGPPTEPVTVPEPAPKPVIPPELKPLEVPVLTTQLESASSVQAAPEPEPEPSKPLVPKPPEQKQPEAKPPAPKPAERKPAVPRANTSSAAVAQGESTASRSDADIPITGARFDADYLHNPAPAYPSYSRRMKERGTVLVLVQVSPQGNASQVTLHQSSGYERLDEAALEAVKQWRFVPAKRGATPVAASVVVPIEFKQ